MNRDDAVVALIRATHEADCRPGCDHPIEPSERLWRWADSAVTALVAAGWGDLAAERERLAGVVEAERDRIRKQYESWLFRYGSAIEPGSRDRDSEAAMDALDVAARLIRETPEEGP